MSKTVKDFIKSTWRDPFKRYLIIALLIVGVFALFYTPSSSSNVDDSAIHFFFHPQCPHCNEQKPFNQELMEKYPDVEWVYHDVTIPSESTLFRKVAKEYGVASGLGVPGTFIGKNHFIGFDSAETTGVAIEEALIAFRENKDAEVVQEEGSGDSAPKTIIDVPFLGTIDVLSYSLPMLAIILGLIDGFNPCAMWVLVFLISIVLELNDRRKIWLLVGTFVFASGVLYFLFMTAWLNVFLLVGYMKSVTVVIGLVAVYFGIISIREYIKTKGALICKVGDIGERQKTMTKIKNLVNSPVTIASFVGIVGLAFVVNSLEFACSAAIPAVFTHVLAISGLSTWQYYGYILLYDLAFMFDDLVIFSLAAFAVNTTMTSKYAKYCKLVGGIIMLALGLLLVFKPSVLG